MTSNDLELIQTNRRLVEIMELVVSEWASDALSVQCFDLRIVMEAKQLVLERKRLIKIATYKN